MAPKFSEGADTCITREGADWIFALAEKTGFNVLYGGHDATETFGVQALAAELSRRFRMPLSVPRSSQRVVTPQRAARMTPEFSRTVLTSIE